MPSALRPRSRHRSISLFLVSPCPSRTHPDLIYVQFSVVALMTPEGRIVERVVYDPYGRGRHHYAADYDGNGAVEVADLNGTYGHLTAWFADDMQADWDRNGTTYGDTPDIFAFQTDWFAQTGQTVAAGQISRRYAAGSGINANAPDNMIGYCGYVFNPETDDYTVRFRHYDPEIGRWLERDPAGYVDGPSYYEYVTSVPIGSTDPHGLYRCGPPETEDQYWCPSRLEDELNRLERRNKQYRAYSCGKGTNTERRQRELANWISDIKGLGDVIGKTLKHAACVAECMVADGQYAQEVIEAIINGALSELPGPWQLELDLDKEGLDVLQSKINEEGFARILESLGIKAAGRLQSIGADNVVLGAARDCETTEKLGRAMHEAGKKTKTALEQYGPKIRDAIRKASRRTLVVGAAVELTCAAVEAGKKCSEECDKKDTADAAKKKP